MASAISDRSPVSVVGAAVRVALKVTPRASADRVAGVAVDAADVAILKVSVTAVPEDGRANAAVIKLLAKRWRVPKTAVTVVSGATDRRKTIEISGDLAGEDAAALATRIDADLTRQR